jgi:hypothetical protein
MTDPAQPAVLRHGGNVRGPLGALAAVGLGGPVLARALPGLAVPTTSSC